ncbi:SDR family NAD(P)-dependent oxidoreductase [Tunturiibacter lichenicola]|uniref:SDR family NAD(P)-dependent oxidoreductase n=1 Tax=Tunturiibacter lichenicola TaxID=2051959 RepID=UPI0021B35904|nr:SDR family oxidoreductase [Edaphobacter lichenicola]
MKDGRVVAITGAGGGIGRKIVDRFLANGDRVIGLDRAKSSLEELATSRNAGNQLSTSCVDITDEYAVAEFAKHINQTHGHVDVLVNCAGFYPVVSFEQMTQEQWLEVIAINLTGTFRVTHALLPLMKSRGWGRIINIGSASVFEGVVGQTHYVSAKAGIVGFTRSLAMEVGDYGITVNIVAPGLTLTEPVLSGMPQELIKTQVDLRAIKRDEQPQDLAGPVFLLCSPDADFVSGQMLVVDGGKIKH